MSADIQPLDFLFGGAGALGEQIDRTIMVVLRDGKHILGTLLSYDQFGSLVLQDARERHMSGSKYADVPMGGIYLVRGENVVIVGEVDEALDAANPHMVPVDLEVVRKEQEDAEEAEEASRRATAAAVAAAAGSTAAAAAATSAAAAGAAASAAAAAADGGEVAVMAPVIAAVVDAGIGGAVPGRAKHGTDRSMWPMHD